MQTVKNNCFERKEEEVEFGGGLAFRRPGQTRQLTVDVNSTQNNKFEIDYDVSKDRYDTELHNNGNSLHIIEKKRSVKT